MWTGVPPSGLRCHGLPGRGVAVPVASTTGSTVMCTIGLSSPPFLEAVIINFVFVSIGKNVLLKLVFVKVCMGEAE